MNSKSPKYHGCPFPPEIISHAVWLYHRFSMSFRDVEDPLAQRVITVSDEAIRLWCIKFGPEYARGLKRRHITESYEVARSSLGTPSRAPRDSNGDVTPAAPACSRNVNSTVPKKEIPKLNQPQHHHEAVG